MSMSERAQAMSRGKMRAGWSKPSTWMTGRRTRLESASIEIVHPLKGMRECTLVIGPVALFAETSRNARVCVRRTRGVFLSLCLRGLVFLAS